MIVAVDLPDDVVELLSRRSSDEGLPLAANIRWLILRGMELSGDFANESAALQRDYPYSGLSDDECVSFLQKVRDET